MTPRHLLAPARLAGSRLLATQSDERLVDLSRAGSEPAFEAIVSRYRGPLLRYCSALLGRERAEDAVQQTFVRAYDAMLRDERPLLLKAWLYRIAHNTAHNALRDHALQDEPLGEEGVGGVGVERPELVLERREQLRSVLASVRDLPPRQRDALVLRELEGRSYEEISAALGVGGGAVRQLLNRARTTLRTAATAITPVGLLLRLPGAGSGAGESVAARVAEMTGAAGAGAVASKVAATALVTGAVAGGAALAPLGQSDGTPTPRSGAAAKAQEERAAGAPATVAPVSMEPAVAQASREAGPDASRGRGDSSGPGSGRDRDRRGEHGGSGHGDRSGPSDSSGPSGDGSGTSGSDSGPGSSSSASGSSGSGSSGSGSSGSGSSGSGSSGSGSSGPASTSSGSGPGSAGLDSSGSDSDSSGSG